MSLRPKGSKKRKWRWKSRWMGWKWLYEKRR